MEPDRLNRWLTLGANLGVLVGILLLVFELNQNRELVRSEIRNDLSDGVVELLSQTAGNGELASIVFRGNSGEALSPLESFQYSSFMKAFFEYAAKDQQPLIPQRYVRRCRVPAPEKKRLAGAF